ncbi:hypothetical protein, partial [Paracoccus sp. (in: a-proteobacteria)]|uniref:hypothetical protein n=1 Tax=Paracoccus sp. TaxID=267 RepID=UPI002AFE8082
SWKAHRKASSQIQRLGGAKGFAESVGQISIAIHKREAPQARLDYLIDEKRFRLPTASAILAVLFPLEFAVYDYRLRDELKFRPIHTNRPGERWARYQEYCEAIRKAAPPNYSLREADKYLWGRSRYEALGKLIG